MHCNPLEFYSNDMLKSYDVKHHNNKAVAPRVGYPKGISSTTSWYSGHPNHDLTASQGVSSRNLICGYKKRYIAIAIYLFLAPRVGLEPTTYRLTAERSTS